MWLCVKNLTQCHQHQKGDCSAGPLVASVATIGSGAQLALIYLVRGEVNINEIIPSPSKVRNIHLWQEWFTVCQVWETGTCSHDCSYCLSPSCSSHCHYVSLCPSPSFPINFSLQLLHRAVEQYKWLYSNIPSRCFSYSPYLFSLVFWIWLRERWMFKP